MSLPKISITQRMHEIPAPQLPLGARSVGWHKIDNGWQSKVRIRNIIQLFWGVSGSGVVRINNNDVVLGENQIAVYSPGNEFYINACNGPWEFWWITIDGSLCNEILKGLGLDSPWPKNVGTCPTSLFEALEIEVHNTSPSAEFSAASTLFQLLSIISSRLYVKHTERNCNLLGERCLSLLHRGYMSQLNISELAEQLNVHRSRLSREFKSHTGYSPQQYLHLLRLRKAALLLEETNLNVKEIAYSTGFASPAYFAKCFKSHFKISPNAFRHE